MSDIFVTDKTVNGQRVINIVSGKFSGVSYHYNSVKFSEIPNKDGNMTVTFDYDIDSNADLVADKPEFEQFLFKCLLDFLEESVKSGTTVFTGGID